MIVTLSCGSSVSTNEGEPKSTDMHWNPPNDVAWGPLPTLLVLVLSVRLVVGTFLVISRANAGHSEKGSEAELVFERSRSWAASACHSFAGVFFTQVIRFE